MNSAIQLTASQMPKQCSNILVEYIRAPFVSKVTSEISAFSYLLFFLQLQVFK